MRVVISILIVLPFLFISCSDTNENSDEQFPRCGVKDEPDNRRKFPSNTFFLAKCAVCHMIDKNTTGPMMLNVVENEPYPGWAEEFVFNQDSLLKIEEPNTMERILWSPVKCTPNEMDKLTTLQRKEFMDYLRSLK